MPGLFRRWPPALVSIGIGSAAAVWLRWLHLGRSPYPDESGLLFVAATWRADGPRLYGHLFVDRPPGLLLFYRLANDLGGLTAARWLGVVCAVLLVIGAGWLGWLVGGRRGAAWASLVSAALVSNPVLGTQEVNGELIGTPFVMLGAAMTVLVIRREAWRRRSDLPLLAVAGLLVGVAPMIKQNLVDGVVFALVLLLAQARRRQWSARRWLGSTGALLAGSVVPTTAAAAWATWWGPGFGSFWEAVVTFRVQASHVLATAADTTAPSERAEQLPLLGLASGMVLLLGVVAWRMRRIPRNPLVVAGLAMLVVELAGVAMGGSYWPHYLIAVVPSLVVLTSSAALPVRGWSWPVTAAVGATLLSSVAVTLGLVALSVGPADSHESAVAGWLSSARMPGDTGLVTYGRADLLERTGLRPTYPFLWSLPLRTLDPRLHHLREQIRGPRAPDWIVEWWPVDTWNLDPTGRTQALIERRYRQVAVICGHRIFLNDSVQRPLPPVPACS